MATSLLEMFPAITVFVLITILGVTLFIVSQNLPQWTESAKDRLKVKNIDISNGGVRLGVKNVSNEEEMDTLQRAFVKTISNSHTNPAASSGDRHHPVKRWKNHEGDIVEERIPVNPKTV